MQIQLIRRRRSTSTPTPPTWSPLDLPNLRGWYDASDPASITVAGGKVSALADLSGNGFHLTQSNPSNQPATGTRTHNGLNVLDYATAGFLTNNAMTLSSPDSVTMVLQMDAVSGNWVDTAGSPRQTLLINGGVWAFFDGATFMGTTFVPAVGTPYVILNQWNAAGTFARVNGGAALPAAYAGHGGSNGFTVGAYPSGAAGVDGWMGEIVVTDGLLTAVEQDQLGTYLATKWGIAW
jgi:hypothetical protein